MQIQCKKNVDNLWTARCPQVTHNEKQKIDIKEGSLCEPLSCALKNSFRVYPRKVGVTVEQSRKSGLCSNNTAKEGVRPNRYEPALTLLPGASPRAQRRRGGLALPLPAEGRGCFYLAHASPARQRGSIAFSALPKPGEAGGAFRF